MATVRWNPVLRPAEDALVYQLHAAPLPGDVSVSLKFSYSSSTMRFDHAEFNGLVGFVEHSYINGRGTVKISADLWPSSSNFMSLVFKGADRGGLHIEGVSIALNGAATISSLPEPVIIGTPTLADYSVNPLPDSLAQEIPKPVLDYISSIYIGAFQRPAEFEGLAYWSQILLQYIDRGFDASGALKGLTRDMHWVGTQNGEAGTDLSTADYIDFVYRNVLGREPDPGGKAYWIDYINEHGRSEFLSDFIHSALEPGNSDGDYVRARIAVSNYFSQESYSGPAAIESGITGRFGDVLDSVGNETTAIAAIQEMIWIRGGRGEIPLSAVLEGETASDLAALMAWPEDADGAEQPDPGELPVTDAMGAEILIASSGPEPSVLQNDLDLLG